MNMRLFIFNIFFIFLSVFSLYPNDKTEKYERKLDRYENRWNKLISQYGKIQYAGSMGFLSFGTGWQYGHDKWETDLLVGVVPRFNDKKTKFTLTFKQNFMPWHIDIRSSRFSYEPLACGMYVNSMLDDRFWKFEPERYPSDYYKFSTKIRFHIFLGQRFVIDVRGKSRTHKSLTFFYELSTCDLYFISAVTNKYLRPSDYLGLSFGLKMQVF